ncbi:MAG: thiamine phosphate synthase [bacterium]
MVVNEARKNRQEFFRIVDLYPVTCERLSAGRSNMEILEAVIKGGARAVQLREPALADGALYRMALKFRSATEKAGVLLIINDRIDIARAVGADGVHLGQDDLPVSVARGLVPELLIGVSTHSAEQALRAQEEGADYVNIGPIFPTKTKEGVDYFLGPDAVEQIGSKVNIPFTVMGGINSSNISQVISRGARKVAMVTAITQAEDVTEAVKQFRKVIADSL